MVEGNDTAGAETQMTEAEIEAMNKLREEIDREFQTKIVNL